MTLPALALTLSLLGLVPRAEPPMFWESHGPAYPFVDVVVAGPDDETVYAAAHDPGSGGSALFRTTDSSEQWDMIAQAPSGETIHEVVIDPTDSRRMLALTISAPPFEPPRAHVYRSADAGASWRLESTPDSATEDLFFDPTRPDMAFLGVYETAGSGVYRSVEDGPWTRVAGNSPATSAWVDPNGTLLWVARTKICLEIPCYHPEFYSYWETAIHTSADAGHTESGVTLGAPCLNLSVVYDSSAPTTVYGWGPTCPDLVRSLDGGYTWGPWDQAGELGQLLHGNPGRRILQVAVAPSSSAVLYALALAYMNAEAGGILRSLDAGRSWEALPGPDGGVTATALGPSGALYAGTPAGVFRAQRTRAVPPRPR